MAALLSIVLKKETSNRNENQMYFAFFSLHISLESPYEAVHK